MKPYMRGRRVLPLLLVVLAGCGSASTAQQTAPTPTPLPPAPALERPTYTVKRGPIERPLDVNGRVAPVDLVQLAFHKAGRVAKVLANPGDHVAAGTVLAELEQGEALDTLRRGQNTLGQAQRDLQQAQAQHDLAVKQAQNNLQQAQADAAQAVTQQAHQIQQAQNSLAQAQRDSAQGAAQQALQVRQAQNNLAQARRDAASSQTQHDLAVKQAQNNLQQAQHEVTSAQGQANGSVTQADLALQRAQANLARLLPGGAEDRVQAAQAALAAARRSATDTKTSTSTAKTHAEDDQRRAANAVQDAQQAYSKAYWDNDWVQRYGTDPHQPTIVDPATGTSRPNLLTDQQKADYRYAFAQAQHNLQDARQSLTTAQRALELARSAEVTQDQQADTVVQQAQHTLDMVLDAQQGDPQIIAAQRVVQDAQRTLDAARRAASGAPQTAAQNAELALAAARNASSAAQTTVKNAELAVEQARRGSNSSSINLPNAALAVEQARHSSNAGAHTSVADAELAVASAQQASFNAQQAAVENAQADLEHAQREVDNGRVIAPQSGDVLSVAIGVGDTVEAYSSVVEIADTSKLEVAAEVSTDQLGRLTVGQPATLSLLARPDLWMPATIRQLPSGVGVGGSGSVAEQDRRTRFSVSDTKGQQLTPGAVVKIHIVLERKANVLWLPPEAIRAFEGHRFVEVRQGDRTRRVPVRVGIETATQAELLDGPQAGDVVIGQ